MTEKEMLSKLKKDPAFRALQSAYAALLPLSPEGRRKVIEALHGLLTVSAGKQAEERKKKR